MEVDGSTTAPDLSARGIITAIVSILEQNGSLAITELGAILGATLGPETSKVVKREFKGLKQLLQNHSDLFQITGKIPVLFIQLKKLPHSEERPAPLPKASRAVPVVTGPKSAPSLSSTSAYTSLVKYLTDIKSLISKGSWKQVASLLRVQHSPVSSSLSQLVSAQTGQDYVLDSKSQKKVAETMDDAEYVDWAQLISLHLLVCFHYYKSHYRPAVHLQTEALKCFDLFWKQNGTTISLTSPNGSMLNVWRVVLTEARQIATWADLSLESTGQESTMLLGLQNHLRPQAKPLEKTPALLLLQNTILRIYAHSNTTSNFNTVLKVMQYQTITSPPFPISDVVTWSFFIGRYHLYQGDYPNAATLLAQAFSRCPAKYSRNKQTILMYLLPVNAMIGTYPKRELLERYKLMEFYEILEGVRKGNFRQYQDGMDRFERALDRGVYLPLRRLTTVLFRNLFKKTALILGSIQTPNVPHPAKITIAALEAALLASGYPTNVEETECIITNLVATKKIRAYISHEHQVLVLAKTDAFPSLKPK